MKVRATKRGYYNHVRVEAGEEFELVKISGHRQVGLKGELEPVNYTPEQQFSAKWMEKVEAEMPKARPSKKQASVVHEDSDVI